MIRAKIGDIPWPSPTCADDITLMADTQQELQQLLDMCFIYSSMERFEIQPSKSMIIVMNHQHQEDHVFTMGGKTFPVVDAACHLGITRDGKTLGVVPTIDAAQQKGRRALYSLMGVGMHGINGVTPKVAFHMLMIYIIPIMIHGLELLLPTEKQLEPITKIYEETMRNMLGLPKSIAKPALCIYS
jgi:hypothetical protein